MATSLTNLKLGQQQQHPGQPYGQPGAAAATSATSTIIEYHGNYKELASNQENLSAAVLAQVSNSTKLREEEEELWLGSPSLFIIVAYYDTFTEGHLLGQHVHLHIVFTAIRGTVRKRRGRRVLIELIIDYRQREESSAIIIVLLWASFQWTCVILFSSCSLRYPVCRMRNE